MTRNAGCASASPGWAGWGAGMRRTSRVACRARELVAACSPVARSCDWAERELGVARRFADYAAMLARPDVDAVFLVTPTTLHAQQIVDALARRQARVLGKAAVARPRRMPARRGGGREASGPQGDDRLRAALRSELPGCATSGSGGRDRPAVHGALAHARQERSRAASSSASRRRAAACSST